jgi:hypothetical protein
MTWLATNMSERKAKVYHRIKRLTPKKKHSFWMRFYLILMGAIEEARR